MENRQPNTRLSLSEQEDKPQAETARASRRQGDGWARLIVIALLLTAIVGTYIAAYVLG